MRTRAVFWITAVLFLTCSDAMAARGLFPSQVGGCALGANIADYREILKMETSLPVRHMTYVRAVETRRIEGFKSGLISYGTCVEPGRIVRVKLKYQDSSRGFYDTLLRRFKERYGEPDEWRGDPFHIVVAWKWSFVDKDNNRVSMMLQHNTHDADQKKGNSVKITMMNFMDEERACFESKHPKMTGKNHRVMGKGEKGGTLNWNLLVPR